MINVLAQKHIKSSSYLFAKRAFDIVFSLLLLVITFPLMLVVALIVKLSSRGPIIFRQSRVGKDRKLFQIFKFRTMVFDAEFLGPQVTAADDERITSIGKILRATKIDELPQFWNVLMGQMSVVGPRPQVPRYVDIFEPAKRELILSVRPGITGPTALKFRHEESLLESYRDRENFYVSKLLPMKCRLDCDYVRNASLKLDIEVFLQTCGVILKGVAHRFAGRPIGLDLELTPSELAELHDFKPLEEIKPKVEPQQRELAAISS